MLFKMLMRLGFERVTPSIVAAAVGEVYHVVGVRKDRRLAGIEISVAVWHPKLDAGISPYRPNLESPVLAAVAPSGAQCNWTWADEAFDLPQIERVIRAFFYGFRSSGDLLAVLEGRAGWEAASERLGSHQSAVRPDIGPGLAKYDVEGGALSITSSKTRMAGILPNLVAGFGFGPSETDPDVQIRRRAGVWDCVKPMVDSYGTIAAIAVYQWIPEVWLAEPAFEGVYHPFNGDLLTDSDGRVSLLSTIRGIDGAQLEELRARLELMLEDWSSRVFDVGTYLATIRSENNIVREKVTRFLKLR